MTVTAPVTTPLQAAFQNAHALQCGFCTPGFIMTLEAFLRERPEPSEAEIRAANERAAPPTGKASTKRMEPSMWTSFDRCVMGLRPPRPARRGCHA